jgi:predicted RNase H-like nuclease
MPTVLGIDAAWTAGEPSGVALVQGQGAAWRCLAVAPSYDAFVGLARGQPVEWTRAAFKGSAANVSQLIDASTRIAGTTVDIVALDMPVAIIPISARRCADNAISVEFGSRWCSAHTPNSRRPGGLGLDLSTAFAELGYSLLTRTTHAPGRCLLEVYPHPALLSLLNRQRRVPYKVSKARRYWPDISVAARIKALLAQFTEIQAALVAYFGDVGLALPSIDGIKHLSSLKRFEDALDALVCAWVGAEHLAGRTVPLGDDTAATWCPVDVVFGRSEPAG